MRMWALDQYYLWRILSVLVAIGLMQLPLPTSWSAWQPQWVLMACLFWLWNHPSRFALPWVVLAAVLTDYLSGLPLGIHVLSYVCLAGMVFWLHRKLMHFNVTQQLCFFLFLLICNTICLRFGFMLASLNWSWPIIVKSQISTFMVWALLIWRFNFHRFWFAHVG